jgi:hypothetical protein
MFQIRLVQILRMSCYLGSVSKDMQEFRHRKEIREIVVFKFYENGSISTLCMISTTSCLFNMHL